MKYFFIIGILLLSIVISTITNAQVKNSGAVITVTGNSAIVISGIDYINETSGSFHGDISLAGTIYLDGNWTNNATGGQLLDSTASSGDVVFNGSSTQTISGRESHFYNMTINNSATVEVAAGILVKVYNLFTNNGNFTLKASSTAIASLIDAGNASKLTGSGNYKLERYIPSAGWHYVSSPLTKSSSSSNIFMSAALYSYNESSHIWNPHYRDEQLDVMKGYDAYYKTVSPTITFSGLFNTGDQSMALTKTYDGYNFTGNPYPSTIDWDASGWTKTNLDNAIYIWDASLNSGQGDYMEYVAGVGNNGGSRYIPPTQAFFVHVSNGNSSGTIGVSNTVKVNKTTTPFRSQNPNEVIRFKVIEDQFENNTLIRIHPEATDAFDGDYDALKMFHSNSVIPQLFTSAIGTDLSINSIPEIQETKTIPLNYKAGRTGKSLLKVNFSEFKELITNYDVFLEDLKEQKIIDLKQQNDYPFETDIQDDIHRFLLHFSRLGSISLNENTLSINEKGVLSNNISCLVFKNEIEINSESPLKGRLHVYNSRGQILISDELNNVKFHKIEVPVDGIYLINFSGTENFIKKVMVCN